MHDAPEMINLSICMNRLTPTVNTNTPPPAGPYKASRDQCQALEDALAEILDALHACYTVVPDNYKRQVMHINTSKAYYRRRSWGKNIKTLYAEHSKWHRLQNQIINHRKEHQGNPPTKEEMMTTVEKDSIPRDQLPNVTNPQDMAKATLQEYSNRKKELKHRIKTETRHLMRKILRARNKHLLHTYKTKPKTLNRTTFANRSQAVITAVRHHATGQIHNTPQDILTAFYMNTTQTCCHLQPVKQGSTQQTLTGDTPGTCTMHPGME